MKGKFPLRPRNFFTPVSCFSSWITNFSPYCRALHVGVQLRGPHQHDRTREQQGVAGQGGATRAACGLLGVHLRNVAEPVAWQGGEPTLLGLEFFQKVVQLEHRYKKPNQRIENDLQTNGTLLDDSWGAFFKENDFLVGISIDGPRAIHDAYRLDKGGRGTFDSVMRGLACLQKHKVEYNVLTTIHSGNARQP